MEEDVDFPIILGRPLLCTSRALTNMERGKLILRVGDNDIVFKFLLKSPIPSQVQNTLCYIDHKTDKVSLTVQETSRKRDKKSEMPKEKGKHLVPKIKVGLKKWVPVRHIDKEIIKKHSDHRDPEGAFGT